MVERDSKIRVLTQLLAAQATAEPLKAAAPADETATLRDIIVGLKRRLGVETRRRAPADDRVAALTEALGVEAAGRSKAEILAQELVAELATVDADPDHDADARAVADLAFGGATILYVGGRANQIAHLRHACARFGAAFLHHDGGKEQHSDLLPGLVSQADMTLFPVDCISHDAALNLKRLCRQMARPYVPLRTASVASFISTMRTRLSQRIEQSAAD